MSLIEPNDVWDTCECAGEDCTDVECDCLCHDDGCSGCGRDKGCSCDADYDDFRDNYDSFFQEEVMHCDKHDFHWAISDPMGCPVCHGVNLEVERRKGYLQRIQTWYPGKSMVWAEGFESAVDHMAEKLIAWTRDPNPEPRVFYTEQDLREFFESEKRSE